MKKILLTLLVITSFLFTTIHAQETHQQSIDNAFGNEGEVYFKFSITDKSEADLLTRIISIDNVMGNEVYAYANKKEFAAFLDLGYPYTLLPHPGSLLNKAELRMGQAGDGPMTIWNFYPTYQQYLDYMVAFAADNPDICRLDTIGYSVQNRLLLAVKISDNVNEAEAEPEFLYSSSIHGDETTGYVLMMHLIDYLLANYGTDPRITDMVNNTEIFICPLANPDGTYHGGNNSVYGAQRYNANYVDLNRNYPDPAEGPHPDGNAWQPETVGFMAYADSNHFVMGANFHGGVSVMNYPWDTWAKLTADDDWWQLVCREYVDTVHLYGPGGYYAGFDDGITNGYQWYRITGGRQDYMNYWHSCREVTNEISDIKMIPTAQLLNYWNYNYRSLLNYIEEVNYGAQGVVTDSVTGAPLDAKIYIFNFDKDNSHVFSKLPSGHYSRLLYEGSYDMTISRTGYFTKLITGVNIVNRQQTPLDVQLIPLNIGTGSNDPRKMAMAFPNPSDGNFRLVLPTISAGQCSVEVYNSGGRRMFSAVYSSASPTVPMGMSDMPSGLYIMRVQCTAGTFEDRIIIR
jgi:hypothetical protein